MALSRTACDLPIRYSQVCCCWSGLSRLGVTSIHVLWRTTLACWGLHTLGTHGDSLYYSTATKGIFQNIQKVFKLSRPSKYLTLFLLFENRLHWFAILPRSLIMATVVPKNVLPSAGWTSYDGWDYNGMKERLERFMTLIDRSSLMEHTQLIIDQPVSISEAFSAGQFWCCFELLAADGQLIIVDLNWLYLT